MKNFIVKSILLLCIHVVFFQCQMKKEGSHAMLVEVNGNDVINCNISEVTDTIDVPLSDIINNCEVIPLETNDSSLFESVYHVGISDNFIAIHSRGRMPIKLFSRKGKFIRNIGAIGRGPGEFTSLSGIQLDEPADRIYLTPFGRAKEIIAYNFEGETQKSVPLIYKQTKCKVYIEEDVVTVLSMPFKVNDMKPIPIAYQQTIAGKLIKEVKAPEHLLINPKNEKGQNVGFNSELFSFHNSGAYDRFVMAYGSQELDTLHHYDTDKNKLVPKFVASFSDKKHGNFSYEFRSHYYTRIFGKKYKGKKVIVNKKTLKSDFFNINNDFYGGYRVNKFYMSNNGMFISSILPIDLIADLKIALKRDDLSADARKKIEALQKTLNENDNEVLFIGEIN